MGRSIHSVLRKTLVQAYDAAVGQGRKINVVKMIAGIVTKLTALDILKECYEQGHFIADEHSGQTPKLASDSTVKRVQRLMDHKDNVSGAMVARKIGLSKSPVQSVLVITTFSHFFHRHSPEAM